MKTSYNCSRHTFTAFMEAGEIIRSKIDKHLNMYDLTHSQFEVLETLSNCGSLCQRDIAKKVLKSKGNLTMVINNLEKRGLVERQRQEQDKRYVTVAMTPRGHRLISTVSPEHASMIAEAMSILTVEEQEQLAVISRKLQTLDVPQRSVEEKTPTYAITKPTRIY